MTILCLGTHTRDFPIKDGAYIYIYTLGALGFRRVSWFSLIHMSRIIVSPQRNVDFAHSSLSFFNDNVTELIF